jgi:hypothetical protein
MAGDGVGPGVPVVAAVGIWVGVAVASAIPLQSQWPSRLVWQSMSESQCLWRRPWRGGGSVGGRRAEGGRRGDPGVACCRRRARWRLCSNAVMRRSASGWRRRQRLSGVLGVGVGLFGCRRLAAAVSVGVAANVPVGAGSRRRRCGRVGVPLGVAVGVGVRSPPV